MQFLRFALLFSFLRQSIEESTTLVCVISWQNARNLQKEELITWAQPFKDFGDSVDFFVSNEETTTADTPHIGRPFFLIR